VVLFRALRTRSFALLWLGQTASRFGDAVHQVAVAWLVVELTHSALAMGTVLTAELVPKLALLLVGGVLVDRVPRIPVMLVSDAVRAIVVLVIGGLVLSGQVAFVHLVALGVIFGTLGAFFQPAFGALVPELVAEEDRSSANSLLKLGAQVAGIAGPLVAAVLIVIGGLALAFIGDALTFAISAVALVAIRRGRAAEVAAALDPGDEGPRSALADLRDGFRTIVAMPWIGLTIVVAGVTNITLAGPIESVTPLLVVRHLGGDSASYGLVTAMAAAGALVGALVLGGRRTLRHRGRLIYGPWLLLAVAVAAMGLPIGVAGVALAAAIVGLCETTLGLAWVHALQQYVPGDRLGRVYSIDALGSYALIPVGYAVAGAVADAVGPAPVFVAGGLISMVLLGVTALHPSIRSLD
jgi:MFS family permease